MSESTGTETAPPAVARVTNGAGRTTTFALSGAWNLRALQRGLSDLNARLSEYTADPMSSWDLRDVDVIDHAGALLLWRASGRWRRAEHLVLKPEHEAVFAHLEVGNDPAKAVPSHDRLWFVAASDNAFGIIEHLVMIVVVLGQVVIDTVYLVRHPSRIPWKEISSNVYRTGAQALGITALVGFLVGVVLSYLSAQQLKLFGADAFIVNILGISLIRELGPVLAAILIAGRSGSAITAQLGVMRVTQELDAMAVMGIPHTLRLILPKMLALAVSMLPLIVLWTNAIALIGGMVSAEAQLGISYTYFLSSLPSSVPIANLWLGLGKGVVLGFPDCPGCVPFRLAH